jgi:WD40 repeat protein
VEELMSAITRRRDPNSAIPDRSALNPGWITETLTPAEQSRSKRTIVFVDQFEECFTHCQDGDERATFFDVVTGAATAVGPVAVVIAVRGDYYGHFAEHPGLAHAVEANTVLVGPMQDAELRVAISGPAAAAGLAVEPGLCDVVVGDVAGRPGALPLLSHALLETWRRRRGHTLTLDAYREVGGVNAAIARTADRVFEQLDAHQQTIARRLCLRLTAVGAVGEDARRRVHRTELTGLDADTGAVDTIIRVFTQARLVTTDETSIEFAHEALLREWPRLRGWIDDDREELRVVARLQSAVTEWQNARHNDIDLYRGVRLDAATQIDPNHLSDAEQHFLTASINHRNTERDKQRRAHRRLQRLVASLAVVLIAAIVAAAIAVRQSNQATHQATRADARGLAAQAIALASSKVDTALLLAAEGYRRDASLDTEGGLLAALNGARYLAGYHRSLPLDADDIALAADGNTLVVLTLGGELRKYDAHTWTPIGDPLVTGIEVPYGLSVSADGRFVAFGAADGVRVVEYDSGAAVGEPLGPTDGILGSFSADGSTIVTTSQGEPLARVFDVGTGQQLGAVTVNGNFAMAEIRPGTDEMLVVPWGSEPTIRRYGLDGTPLGDPVMVNGMRTFLGAGYSKDGKHILVYDNNATGQLLDPDTLAPVGTPFTVRGSRAGDASWSPDGARLALAADDGSIRIVRTEDGSVETTISGLTGGAFVEFLDDDRILALTNTEAAEYDLRRTTALGTTSVRDQYVYDLVATQSGTAALADQAQRIVQLAPDLSEGPIDFIPPDYYASAIAVTDDGKSAAIQTFTVDAEQNIDDGFVNIVELPAGSELARFELNGPDLAASMAFSPDGTRLAAGTRGGSLAIFDARSGLAIVPITQLDSGHLGALAWSSDSSVLYGGGQDGLLRVLDPSSGSVETEISLSPTIALTDAVRVPGTTLLAVASESGEVYFVDMATRKEVGQPLTSGGTQLQALAITPDAKRIASVSRDGAVRLWDRASGRPIGPPLEAHGVQTGGITYLDEGSRLMTGGFDGTIISWDMTPEAWAAQACALAGRNLTQAEWEQYLPGKTYHKTCPSFPEG